MNTREEIKKIWRECFSDSVEYVNMYFDRVYNEADAMLLIKGGHPVSSLLLQRYRLLFHGQEMGMSYVAGAATKRSARGKGFMSELMLMALDESYARGDMLCTLIPAHDWLYFYYDRFDFATVFYIDPQRFTSSHSFPVHGTYRQIEDPFTDDVFKAFCTFERQRKCVVLHSHRDFLNILDDLRMDNEGHFVAMADEEGNVASMAWAIVSDGRVIVNELLGRDEDARTAALHQLRAIFPDYPFKVLAPPLDEHRKLYSRGMARMVNVKKCLEAIAAENVKVHMDLRVTDHLLPDNSHIYRVANGECRIDDGYTGRLDFDVSVDVFSRIVFSSGKIGDILGFPSVRPHLSLMLD